MSTLRIPSFFVRAGLLAGFLCSLAMQDLSAQTPQPATAGRTPALGHGIPLQGSNPQPQGRNPHSLGGETPVSGAPGGLPPYALTPRRTVSPSARHGEPMQLGGMQRHLEQSPHYVPRGVGSAAHRPLPTNVRPADARLVGHEVVWQQPSADFPQDAQGVGAQPAGALLTLHQIQGDQPTMLPQDVDESATTFNTPESAVVIGETPAYQQSQLEAQRRARQAYPSASSGLQNGNRFSQGMPTPFAQAMRQDSGEEAGAANAGEDVAPSGVDGGEEAGMSSAMTDGAPSALPNGQNKMPGTENKVTAPAAGSIVPTPGMMAAPRVLPGALPPMNGGLPGNAGPGLNNGPFRHGYLPAEVELPFEVIDFTEEITITVRRHKLLRYKSYISQVQIADPSVVEASVYPSGHELGLIGVGQGATTVTLWFLHDQAKPVTFLVRVQPDPEVQKRRDEQYAVLEEIIREQFPDSKVHLEARSNKLFVKGQAKDAEEAHMILTLIRDSMNGQRGGVGYGGGAGGWLSASGGAAAGAYPTEATGRANDQVYIINRLRVPGVQTVALKVKLAELNRTAARNFNMNVRGNINFDDGTLIAQSLVNLATQGTSALSGTFSGDDISFSIRFLKQHGVVRLLSEPTLVAMSGQPAYFHAGGEFAVPTTVGVAGASAVTTNFRAFGSIVTFIPTVVDGDRIRLQIYPEFTQINNNLSVNNIPGLNSRGAGTTVELREGQTYAIAGLIDDSFTANRAGDFPFIGNILGARTSTAQETELLILVTPELVHPMDPEEVPPLPGFDVTQPTDVGFYLLGQTEGYPTHDHRATVWPRLYRRYQGGTSNMLTNEFGHGK